MQVQYQGLFQMIAVLGIGGTFQNGFQVSTITYMSQVGKDSHSTLVNGVTESALLSEDAPLTASRGFIIPFSSHVSFPLLCYCVKENMSKC